MAKARNYGINPHAPLKPFIPFLLALPAMPACGVGFSFIFFGFSFLLKMFVGVAQNFKARTMNTPNIKTHYKKSQYFNDNHFFILSKGNNAGKPMHNPCPNCFVLSANNRDEREFYFWLCYGLWVGGFFRQVLCGSVISFLRIPELQYIIRKGQSKVEVRRDALTKAIVMLNKLTTHQENLSKQLDMVKQAKQSVMYHLLK